MHLHPANPTLPFGIVLSALFCGNIHSDVIFWAVSNSVMVSSPPPRKIRLLITCGQAAQQVAMLVR